jgi:glutamate N-acetyltransferase/amino-acid N-acetyltransferase
MDNAMKKIEGGVIAARAFRCAAVGAGIKTKPGALDVSLILSDRPAAAAAMFTTNRVCAAPVRVSREVIAAGRRVRGVVVNAGNANACTGARGMKDARSMTTLAEATTGAPAGSFLVASTGIIGRPMPMQKVASGIRAAAAALGDSADHAEALRRAIMTTDTVPKSAAVQTLIGGKTVRIGGICKGAGMIAPNMATMLAFVTTDCAIAPAALRKALRDVVDRTFNSVTIDGDTSTNDTIFLLANGAAANAPVAATGRDYDRFHDALFAVAAELARAIARDGEGATRFVEVRVTGARTPADARTVAKAIANSPLVKCAIHGGDPNWGRITCAAGYSGAPVLPEMMKLRINGTLLFKAGMPTRVAPDALKACMAPKDIRIHLELGQGRHERTMWTCDFSREYIAINADYHT